MFSSYGTLAITPAAPYGHWWLHVICCNDLGRYYRYWLVKRYGYDVSAVQNPKWGTHITVIRREKVLYENIEQWNGKLVEFDYDHDDAIGSNGKHFWLQVRCDRLKDIRERVGLPRKPIARLHITFGVLPGGQEFYPD